MAKDLNFNCSPTMIGSVPYTDPASACAIITKYLKDWPAWPQLTGRDSLENMYIQFSQGFPGIKINDQKITFEQRSDLDQKIEQIVYDSLNDNFENYSISKEYAAGLHYFTRSGSFPAGNLKGQITGPISWGLCVTDCEGRGIIYDEMLAETIARFLKLKASWQEKELRRCAGNTIIFVDEPYLTSLGSAFVALSNEQVASLLNLVLEGIRGTRGIHCCGSTDWSLLLRLPLHIISFDAYNYLDSFICYISDIHAYLDRGGCIAWGIVPNDEETLKKESLAQIHDRLCEAINTLVRPGVSFRDLVRRSLITPVCGLASLTEESAEFALGLLRDLSEKVSRKYGN